MNNELKILIRKLNLEFEKGKKHDIYILRIESQFVGQFGVSRGSKEEGIPSYAYKQLGIDKQLFKQLIGCTADLKNVTQHLRDKNLLAQNAENEKKESLEQE